jgi:tetraacyldisaccharide 4'-kinase
VRAPDFWRRQGVASALLAPAGWLSSLATRLRLWTVTPWRAPERVLCVGTLVAGGAGKTPVVLNLGARLIKSGVRVHFVGRGYGGSAAGPLRVDVAKHDAATVGDEALLLARAAPTWIAHDRVAGVRAATGADVVILDDGLQDPSVAKDFSLAVVDGRYGFGNRRVIPAGPLRESVRSGLARADALVVIGVDKAGVVADAAVRDRGIPVLQATVKPGPEATRLTDKPVVAFAGIGRPEKFFDTLEGLGCRVAAKRAFADHHPFTSGEIERLKTDARKRDARLVTTEKDAVRLPMATRDGIEVLTITLVWSDELALDGLLQPLVTGAD